MLALLIAASAMYGIGLPLAWLLPAPIASPWAYRIAIAPLYSIVVAAFLAWVLGVVGASLQPLYLVALAVLAWTVAWRVAQESWRVTDWKSSSVPLVTMTVASAVVWLLSLIGYGLHLPNRDYKNHAYWVAQVSFERSADPSLVLRSTPLSVPAQDDFYPLGLHTLLGWALPTSDWNALGVTAAAAIICTAVSLPLAGVVLARLWMPDDGLIWTLTGFALAFFPGMTGAFGIGSVTILVAGALYSIAVASLWMWLEHPGGSETIAVALTGAGLFLLHIAEAWGLMLLAIGALAIVGVERLRGIPPRTWLVIAAALATSMGVAVVILRPIVSQLTDASWDIQPNDQSISLALLRAFAIQPGGNIWPGMLWMILALLGLVAGYRRNLSMLPALALAMPMLLAVFASTPGVPVFLNMLTAPWYGSDSRIYLMAGPPIALLGCLGLVVLRDHVSSTIAARPWRVNVNPALVLMPGLALLVAISADIVPDRRSSLAATLAGAGDTPRVARAIERALLPGETIMNLEGDGTANLFAIARLPVLSGSREYDGSLPGGRDFAWLSSSLMNVQDREVAAALSDLGVRFIAIGTTSLYWDTQVGYDVDLLIEQDDLYVFAVGSHMTVLEYRAEAR
jgi:hypothetical protein